MGAPVPPNRVLHAFLTVLTGSAWGLLVWLPLEHRYRKALKAYNAQQARDAEARRAWQS